MPKIGYHASHEQFRPSELLTYLQQAEQAGFNTALSSDHFHPWSEQQGQSGYAWTWMGAAMQATSLPMRVVCAPGQRYHPAIIAQAAATLADLFPERFWLTLGSGQAVNEHITGDKWLIKRDRNTRLKECVEIIRALWAGEVVTHHGLVCVEEAKLYTRPPVAPLIIGAAVSSATAEWVGGWADGLITTSRPPKKLKQVVEAFHQGGGAGKPMILKVQLSYDPDEALARQGAHDQWRNNVYDNALLTELQTPWQFDTVGKFVQPEELDEHILISADPQQHLEWLQEYLELGFSELILHNVNRNQQQFIAAFGDKVIPKLLH